MATNDELLDEIFGDTKPVPGKRPLRTIDNPPAAQTRKLVVDDEWDKDPVVKMLRGVRTEFFEIGHLARALGRSTVTIRSWEDKGWLPHATYRTQQPKGTQVPGKKTKGRRLYTRAQIDIIITAAVAHGVMDNGGKNAKWSAFRRDVLDGWTQLS